MFNLTEKWSSLKERERRSVTVGAFLLLIVLIISFVNMLSTTVTNLQTQVNNTQALSAWMQPRISFLQQQKPINMVDGTMVSTTITTVLKQTSFANTATQITQNNDGTVHITFKQAPFDDVMDWLVQLWQTNEIQVTDFSLQKTSKLGIVDMTLTLASAN